MNDPEVKVKGVEPFGEEQVKEALVENVRLGFM